MKRLLIVVDMQTRYLAAPEYEGLTERVYEYTKECRETHDIVFIVNAPKGKAHPLADCFAAETNVFSKTEASALAAIPEALLSGREGVTVVGIDGCCCVARTAEALLDKGFSVTLKLSCIGTKRPDRYNKALSRLLKKGVLTME